MTTPLEAAENAQYRQFDRFATPVRYRRESVTSDGVVSFSLNAKIGNTLFRAENQSGITTRTEGRDFIVKAENFTFEPAAGDIIEFNGRDYMVGAPNSEDCWRWHDRYHHREMRIHTWYNGKTVTEAAL